MTTTTTTTTHNPHTSCVNCQNHLPIAEQVCKSITGVTPICLPCAIYEVAQMKLWGQLMADGLLDPDTKAPKIPHPLTEMPF
jgi:hypothetical protein